MIEEEKDAESGVEFLTSSRENWKDSLYGGHLTWHLALYHLGELITRVCSYRNLAYNERLHLLPVGALFPPDLGNIEAVLAEYDSVLCDKVGGFLGLVDAASLLWRLSVMGKDPGEERWQKVVDAFTRHHLDHRALTW